MALFENFPYTNIHELNLDWIVKIAKDFLEQYTHIQQLISDGETSLTELKETSLAELQEKADALEAALQAWYDTHSENIAQELADALADLNAWYTEHSGDISTALQDAVNSFNEQAVALGQRVIESIPEDYSDVALRAIGNSDALLNYAKTDNLEFFLDSFNITGNSAVGLTFSPAVGGLKVTGTQTDIAMKTIYEGSMPSFLQTNVRYCIEFPHNKPVQFQIFGYSSDNVARTLYNNDSARGYFIIPEAFSNRILVRFRFPTNGTTWNDTLYVHIFNPITKTNITPIVNLFNMEYVKDCIDSGITVTTDKHTGTIKVNGTASANVEMYITDEFTGLNQVIMSGGASGGNRSTYYIGIYEEGAGRIDFLDGSETKYKVVPLDPEKTYTGRIYVLRGVTVNNAVFKPIIWGNEYLYDLSSKKPEGILNYRYYKGYCSIVVCGSKIIIDCDALRLFNVQTSTYTASLTGAFSLNLGDDVESVRYIHFDGTNFSVNNTFDANTIASVGSKLVRPFLDRGIIADHRLIQQGYIKLGTPYHVNFKRAGFDAYSAYSNPEDVKIAEQAYMFTTPGTKYYMHDKESLSFQLLQNTSNVVNKKILMIGDSFVARGYIQHYLSQFEPTLQFVGTRNTIYYNYKSEGVSGSRLYYFTDPETSPFYFNGALDFSAYLNVNNIPTPDYVVINSAINHSRYSDSEHGSYHEQLTELINMIRSFSESIKIYVTYGANYAMTIPSTYGYPNGRDLEVLKCTNSVYDTENTVIIPVNQCLIDDIDYVKDSYNYYGKQIDMYNDCVHPEETTGFRKISEMIYNYLGM